MKAGEEIALDPASALARTIDRVERAGAALRGVRPARIDAALASAAAMLLDPTSPLGKQARATIPARAGLSSEGVEWALETTLEVLTPIAIADARAALEALDRSYVATPVRLSGIVLAGNVFSAGIRPIAWSLLCRVPGIVKVATTDAGLSELFALALTIADEEIGAAIGVVQFSRNEPELLDRIASAADVLSVHGSQQTITDVRARAPATTEIVTHGHGLGAVLVGQGALTADADVKALVASIALDVAAYDQRGCLSPQVVLVERGGAVSARELARRLSEDGLAAIARTMPRAALSTLEGATQVRWRGVAQALGELFEGDGWSVAYEADGAIRSCPLLRNVAVHEVRSLDDALVRLAHFGAHLKVLAVAPASLRSEMTSQLPPGLAPRLCAPGRMQRPPLEAATDGVVPWQGLVRLAGRA